MEAFGEFALPGSDESLPHMPAGRELRTAPKMGRPGGPAADQGAAPPNSLHTTSAPDNRCYGRGLFGILIPAGQLRTTFSSGVGDVEV